MRTGRFAPATTIASLVTAAAAASCIEPARRQVDSVRDTVAALIADSSHAAAFSHPASEDDTTGRLWLIAPQGQVALIGSRTSQVMLDSIFGVANVVRDSIHAGEGHYMPGTVLFPNDSLRRLEISWHDTIVRDRPESITITSNRDRWSGSRSKWVVYPGITLGTSLLELERLNEKPFAMLGFDSDGGGAILVEGGRLSIVPADVSRLIVRLAPGPGATHDSTDTYAMGGEITPSTDRSLRRLDPRVYEISVWFRP